MPYSWMCFLLFRSSHALYQSTTRLLWLPILSYVRQLPFSACITPTVSFSVLLFSHSKSLLFVRYFLPLLIVSAELIKSKFARRPSVRMWLRLSLNILYAFLSNFRCWLLCAIRPEVVELKKIHFQFFTRFFFFSFPLTWDPMGAKFQKTLLLQFFL